MGYLLRTCEGRSGGLAHRLMIAGCVIASKMASFLRQLSSPAGADRTLRSTTWLHLSRRGQGLLFGFAPQNVLRAQTSSFEPTADTIRFVHQPPGRCLARNSYDSDYSFVQNGFLPPRKSPRREAARWEPHDTSLRARRWRSHREFDEIVIIRQFVSQDLTELAMNANLDALRAAERRSAVCCAWTWGKSPATGGIADPTTFGDQRLQQDQSNATLVQCG